MVFSEINSALSLWHQFQAWCRRQHATGPASPVASRFVELFVAHGVHRNQIPRLLGSGLALADLVDGQALSASLTHDHLERAATLFGVQLAWLEGATEQVYTLHDFYKQPERFAEFLGTLQARCSTVGGALLVSDAQTFDLGALLILEEPVGELDARPLYRYHLCSNWVFDYWKARAYLAACVAIACRHGVSLIGRRVPVEVVRKYADGTALLESDVNGALLLRGAVWHPEDLLIKPHAFLSGLGEGTVGQTQGLQLWLALDAAGWMNTDQSVPSARAAFTAALDDLRANRAG